MIRRLEEHPEKFGSDVLATLSSVADMELTKRDAAVCGGEGYLNNHWFERGELPPVGEVVTFNSINPNNYWAHHVGAELTIVSHDKDTRGTDIAVYRFIDMDGFNEYHGLVAHAFRPIRTERDKAIDEMKQHCPHHGSWDSVGRIYAEALYDAGYRKQK